MHRTELIHPHISEMPEQITCVVLAGPPGSGKSTRLTGEAIHISGVIIIAAQRIDLVEEHAALLRALIDELDPGLRPTLQVIHSEQAARESVDRRLREALLSPVTLQLIIVTTHAALMGLGEEDVVGCHVRIDEIPEPAIVADEIGLGASWPDSSNPGQSPQSARSKASQAG